MSDYEDFLRYLRSFDSIVKPTNASFRLEHLKKCLEQLPKKKPEELWPGTQYPFARAYSNLLNGLPVYFSDWAAEKPAFIPGIGVIARSKEDLEKYLEEEKQ